ncbi:16S rRNA (cytosine(1402)-N(4))-methyltransferase [Helicobacter sp. 16-1353]|uniref:16S rRNA (cytosine(1402)-N(4))-methyltransferase RsmH n=1 Tax=Helicobacter sp. 16-1353 TaxID=2004996 RepID=UPI000DCEF9A4|nr:16S rRNA (cytosine(1402)-N(4))-methyltransferase RsmH [Helicobacter sp. 16-1353]RAX54684.1 16S rRNA (cytosine(1402)-N(4))-methyltransferase [Helicobacter sp. 16-1353]
MNPNHIPVLCDEVCGFFADSSGLIVDATLGLGGHSLALLESNPKIKIIGIDKDREALNLANDRLSHFGDRFSAIHSSFAIGIKKIINENKEISGILADIGISSYQIDNPNRGFSFYSENLDMRMDLDSTIDAKMIVNSYTKEELNRIFMEYGEIKNPNNITKLILDYRRNRPINTAKELSNIIELNTRGKTKIHPATLIFQALRIEVNNELEELERFLDNTENLKNTKIAIISFHSLEDRIVKERFRLWAKNCICNENVMKCECGNNNAKGVNLTKKPIIPSAKEIALNNRSRSAKMRGFRFYE